MCKLCTKDWEIMTGTIRNILCPSCPKMWDYSNITLKVKENPAGGFYMIELTTDLKCEVGHTVATAGLPYIYAWCIDGSDIQADSIRFEPNELPTANVGTYIQSLGNRAKNLIDLIIFDPEEDLAGALYDIGLYLRNTGDIKHIEDANNILWGLHIDTQTLIAKLYLEQHNV